MSGDENIKKYEKRYGNIAIQKGFITPEQLIEAMHVQVMEEINDCIRRPIGAILTDQNCITIEQHREILNY